jgi:predicted aldo/keto reductase-like oxidoreductase
MDSNAGADRHPLDLLAIHGINLPEHLEQTLRPGGCMEVARRWQGRAASAMWDSPPMHPCP